MNSAHFAKIDALASNSIFLRTLYYESFYNVLQFFIYSASECSIIFSGDTTKTEICRINVCLFPRISCCPGYNKILDRVNRIYYCGPLPNNSVPIQPTTCCDPGQQFLLIFKSFRKRLLTN